MIVAISLILVAVGTVVFHFASPWWWTPIASNWGYIDDTIILTFWITGVVFIAVILFMAYCIVKFRYKEGNRAEYEPENKKLEWWLTILTGLGVAGMLIPGLFVWDQFVTVPKDASKIEVMAQQWQWSFRYPGKDGVLGTSDKPGEVLLRSIDVLHDFYVPQFRAKMDMVPGMITYFWLTPTRTGTFDIMCFELCGVGHYTMRGNVVVETKDSFEEWMSEQETFAQSLARAENKPGQTASLVLKSMSKDERKERAEQ